MPFLVLDSEENRKLSIEKICLKSKRRENLVQTQPCQSEYRQVSSLACEVFTNLLNKETGLD